ncbi:MAG: ATP-binding protein [Candidatus Heteroscillospira sp.]|jgi:signal transduction histidine kinase
MNLKTRILFQSAAMVLICLVLMLAVGGNVIRLFSKGERVDVVVADSAFEAVTESLRGYESGDSIDALAEQLSSQGYQLAVSRNGAVVYSNVPPEHGRSVEMGMDIPWSSVPGAVNQWGGSIIGRSTGDELVIALRAVEQRQPMGGLPPVFLSFMINGLLAILLILPCSVFFTNRITAGITGPLSELADAARRVESGDLTQPVLIRGANEFSEVCETFNNMQLHLLAEREKNAAYEKARTDLVSGISHDLRTPLTSVKGYIKGLRDGVASTPEKRERYLSVAYERACDMEKLIARLLDFSRLETGHIPMDFRPEDLGDFACDFAAMLSAEYPPADVRVSADVEKGKYPVLMDEAQMRRVLFNLTDNALKYSGVLPMELKLRVFSRDGKAVLRFSDNGVGVRPEQLPKLFDEFWRGDAARSSTGVEGSGLGLYIVKYIAEAHGGSVSAENSGGLAIELSLPLREDVNENSDC